MGCKTMLKLLHNYFDIFFGFKKLKINLQKQQRFKLEVLPTTDKEILECLFGPAPAGNNQIIHMYLLQTFVKITY